MTGYPPKKEVTYVRASCAVRELVRTGANHAVARAGEEHQP